MVSTTILHGTLSPPSPFLNSIPTKNFAFSFAPKLHSSTKPSFSSVQLRRNQNKSCIRAQQDAKPVTPAIIDLPLSRKSFPKGFVFGAGGAAYQYEGAYNIDGKGLSIWDKFSHEYPEKIADGSNGDVANDSYHRYEEDVKALTDMNLDAYRFSISWPRLIPTGRVKDGVNQAGIDYYNKLINLCIEKGVQPYGTLFHWDVPQGLEDEYLGFLSLRIVEDFADYADLCFKEFGDRVKHWITLNEPCTFTTNGYNSGATAPGRCSSFNGTCPAGDSATEPYVVGHNLLLSHAAAVKVYREKYQKTQDGKIGITNPCLWMLPLTDTEKDKAATQRSLDFVFGWYTDPVVFGEYPESMRRLVGDRLPKFTKEQSDSLKGSYDFLGINYYTGMYAYDVDNSNAPVSYNTDSNTGSTPMKDGELIGPPGGSEWLHVHPEGLRSLMLYCKERYNDPVIYITENGTSEVRNDKLSLEEALKDDMRIDYHNQHMAAVLKSMNEGVKVESYFAWSLLDNYEWNAGYTVRFGLYFVDYNDNLQRYPKHSALWFKKFLE